MVVCSPKEVVLPKSSSTEEVVVPESSSPKEVVVPESSSTEEVGRVSVVLHVVRRHGRVRDSRLFIT